MRPSLSRWIEKAWYSQTWPGLIFSVVLLPITGIYWLVTSLRRQAYRIGLFSSVKLDAPVIVVGNITTGGTGKTPVVVWLARLMQAQGYKPGIVSRGYGGNRTEDLMLVTSESLASEVGDEPFLIARATGFPVQVGADRAAAASELLRSTDVDLIISDDGLQHYRMQRSVELVVVDSDRNLGNGFLLPSGPLRELRSRLDSVDAVLVNGGESADGAFGFKLLPGPLVNLATEEQRALSSFSGETVRALAGIGNPQRFYSLLEAHGVEVLPIDVTDHGVVDIDQIASAELPVLMTEKDAVKYDLTDSDHCWYLPVRAAAEADAELRLLGIIRAALGDKR